MAWGPKRMVRTWPKYFVNGFKFHTRSWGEGKKAMNSGVWVKGTNGEGIQDDYFGMLDEIVELEYVGEPIKRVVLFACEWFDPTPRQGTRIVHPEYLIIEVKYRSRYKKYDPFIVAQQVRQVYYVPYPSNMRDKANWWAVIKTKARARVEIKNSLEVAYQNDFALRVRTITSDELVEPLIDRTGPLEDVDPNDLNIVGIMNDTENEEDEYEDGDEDGDEDEDESTNSYSD